MPASKGVPVHVPLVQNCPSAHVLPHAPQLVGSTAVFTHALIPSNGHEVRPGGHVMPASMAEPVQVLLEQNCPIAQALPHAPQFEGSNVVSVQTTTPLLPTQAVNPEGQLHEASGSFSCDVDCALLGGSPLPEHAARDIPPTREPTINVAAHQREGIGSAIINALSLGGDRAGAVGTLEAEERGLCPAPHQAGRPGERERPNFRCRDTAHVVERLAPTDVGAPRVRMERTRRGPRCGGRELRARVRASRHGEEPARHRLRVWPAASGVCEQLASASQGALGVRAETRDVRRGVTPGSLARA
jgi:hypothetical protein